MSFTDEISDEEMMKLIGQYDRNTSTPTAGANSPNPNITTSSSVQSQATATGFNTAFASFTNSSMYTSIANMPLPQPKSKPPPNLNPSGTPVDTSIPPPTITSSSNSSHRVHQTLNANLPPPKPKASSAHSILVSPRQKGNPLLVHISNVAYEFGPKTMLPDYEISETTCALYLSLKYHMLHGTYLQSRLQSIRSQFTTRVILVYVDVEDSEKPMLDITRQSFAFEWTVVCCWSSEEMARYLETFKMYDKKTSDSIQERIDDSDHKSKLTESLTMIRSVNKTDVNNLVNNFGSFASIAKASKEDLLNCPGMGEKKVHRLFHVLNQPFVTSQASHRFDSQSSTLTPTQLNAIHASNIAKAKAEAQQAATQKKGAVKYIDNVYYQSSYNTPTAATGASSSQSSSSSSASSSASSTLTTTSSSASSSANPAPMAVQSVAKAPTTSPAPVPTFDPTDFIS